jgi:hypothetical protein
MKTIRIIQISCLVAAVTGVSLVYVHTATPEVALATTMKPDPFTELSFNSVVTLPTHVIAGQSTSFTFTISNKELKTMNYVYTITQTDSATPQKSTTSTLTIPAGQTRNIKKAFIATVPSNTITISVSLPLQAETIQFRSKS